MVRQVPKAAGGILSYFTRHRTVANLLLVVMVVAGLAAIPNMRAQFFPDVILDNVSVTVVWDGAGAEDVDAGIVQVLEPGLLAVEGVESSESVSREGRAAIQLETGQFHQQQRCQCQLLHEKSSHFNDLSTKLNNSSRNLNNSSRNQNIT